MDFCGSEVWMRHVRPEVLVSEPNRRSRFTLGPIDVEDPPLALQSSLPHVKIAFDFNIDDAGGFVFQYKRGGFCIYAPRPDIPMFPFF